MTTLLIFIWIYLAMIAMSFWESSVEGRNSFQKGKHGWKLKLGKYYFARYHFYVFVVMWPLLLTLSFVIYGFDLKLFGIIISAYFSGLILEDFMWYVVNPVVKFKEFYTNFSDYYPWIKINNKKIIPLGYLVCMIIALFSWYFLWR